MFKRKPGKVFLVVKAGFENVGSVFLVNLNFFKSVLKDLSYDNRNLR